MTISVSAAFAASLCFAITAIWAGIMDLASMKIRNDLVLFLLAIYAALAPLAGFGAIEIGWSAVTALSVLAVTFICFSFGWIGGGDAKLAAVIALWVGAENTLPFLLYTALFGGVLTLALLQFRSMPLPVTWLRASWLTRLHSSGSGVPYGVAIALGALFVFPHTTWMVRLG